eukprot:110734-Heterocapsa_arctica.AAC.1
MDSAGLANGAESKVERDTPVAKHSPVILKIGGKLGEDMGLRIGRPIAFQGMTRKEAKVHGVLENDFVKESLDEQWKHWSESSESFWQG